MMEDDLKRLAAHYDGTDLSGEIDRAEHDDEVDADPMITTSLRLPKSVLDQVRAAAAASGVKPTQLMRRWIEHAAAGTTRAGATVDLVHPGGADRAVLVGDLEERLVAAIESSGTTVRDIVRAELEPVLDLLRKQAS